jgi:prophage antirepressor-like protein
MSQFTYNGNVVEVEVVNENPQSERDLRIGGGVLVQALSLENTIEQQVDEDGVTWFNGSQLTKNLGYKNSSQSLGDNVNEADISIRYTSSSGQGRNVKFINESGLYSLILGSTLESAKKFKHWVTSTVLPSIRKTGSYSVPKAVALHPADEFTKYHVLAGYLGLKNEQAAIHANHATRKKTGEDILALMEIKFDVKSNTRSITNHIKESDLKITAVNANAILFQTGYLEGAPGKWKLTALGETIGKLVSTEVNGKMRNNIEWSDEVVYVLQSFIKI